MKLPSHLYLEQRNIPYEARGFSPETDKGAANVARVLGFSERQAVKTLIFQMDTGERVLVMLGGDQNAISGNLKKRSDHATSRWPRRKPSKKRRDTSSAPSPLLAGNRPDSVPSLRRVSLMNPSWARAQVNGAKRS